MRKGRSTGYPDNYWRDTYLWYVPRRSHETKDSKSVLDRQKQGVRLPKEFRFEGDKVLVRREGNAVILEPSTDWPEGYVESFTGVTDDFVRPPQEKLEKRQKIG